MKAVNVTAVLSIMSAFYGQSAFGQDDDACADARPGGFQDVAFYDGSAGVSREFVDIHERAAVRLRYDNGGTCSGTFLPGNLVLTAGHCAPENFNPENVEIDFNFQLGPDGNEVAPLQSYNVLEVLESVDDAAQGHDHAILRIDPAAADRHPVARLRRGAAPRNDEMTLTAINHSAGQLKRVETGTFNQVYDTGWYETVDLDFIGGGSGSALLDSDGKVVSVLSRTACPGGMFHAGGPSIEKLSVESPEIRAVMEGYTEEYLTGYINGFENGIQWTNTGDFDWQLLKVGTPSSGTGPAGGAGGSRTYAYFETSETTGAFNQGEQAELVSHSFRVAAGNIGLGFDYHMFGENTGTLAVDVLQDGTWSNVWSRAGQQHVSSDSAWSSAVVDLARFEGSTIRVRFRAVAAGNYRGDIGIDNIEFLSDTNFTLRNFWASRWHLNIQDGPLVATEAEDDWQSAQWGFEQVGDFYRIFNRSNPDQFLHVDHTTRGITTGAVGPGWHSAQWRLVPVISAAVPEELRGQVFRLENRWIQAAGEQPRYLNVLESGRLEARDVDAGWWTSWWIID